MTHIKSIDAMNNKNCTYQNDEHYNEYEHYNGVIINSMSSGFSLALRPIESCILLMKDLCNELSRESGGT